jgi:hypothetical protein
MKPIDRDKYRITSVKALKRGKVQLKYINGYWIEVDLRDLADKGGLAAKPHEDAFLVRGRTQDHGSYLEWPNGLSLSAETLWEWGKRVVGEDELTIGAGPAKG